MLSYFCEISQDLIQNWVTEWDSVICEISDKKIGKNEPLYLQYEEGICWYLKILANFSNGGRK